MRQRQHLSRVGLCLLEAAKLQLGVSDRDEHVAMPPFEADLGSPPPAFGVELDGPLKIAFGLSEVAEGAKSLCLAAAGPDHLPEQVDALFEKLANASSLARG